MDIFEYKFSSNEANAMMHYDAKRQLLTVVQAVVVIDNR